MNPTPNNLTLSDQEDQIREYVGSKGWNLVHILAEKKISNNDLAHGQLEELMRAASKKEFDVLVIARLDRLTRNIRHLNTIISSICIQNEIGLVSIEEGLNTFDESGRLAIHVIDIVTKWDNKRISDRTREIIARKREKGERVGHAPFGYTYHNKKLVAVDEEIKVAGMIQEKRNAGMSYHKIAKMLNDKKIGSKRGGIWYAETVKTVFQSPLFKKVSAG